MAKRAIFPPGSKETANQIKVSPGVVSGAHVFLTGITGSGHDGAMPQDPEEQFHKAFQKIAAVLEVENLTLQSVVEMTSYHVGLRNHFDLFNAVRCEYIKDPFPAWTAVEVAGLRREGALVEIRVVAETESCC